MEHDESNLNNKTRTSKRIANQKRKPNESPNQNEDNNKKTVKKCKRSSSTLVTINNDCLTQIFTYLNIEDILNLAATCKRLQNVALTDFFPRKAKQIKIVMLDATTFELKAPLIDNFSSELRPKFTLQRLETALTNFGEFVDDLTLDLSYRRYGTKNAKLWRCGIILLEHCKYLKTLRYRHWTFTPTQIRALHKQIERFENLNELVLLKSNRITNTWPAGLKSISKIDKISLNGEDEISAQFVQYFRNLASLTIDFPIGTVCKINDVAQFVKSCHCLKHLELTHISQIVGYESIGAVIGNLPKLETLSLRFELTDKSEYLIGLPHLKTLAIAHHKRNINTLLQTLSCQGIIEELMLWCGFFDDEDKLPLFFNNLQIFEWYIVEGLSSNFLNIMTGSQMPKIHTFMIDLFDNAQIQDEDLLKFVESKKTLKSISVDRNATFDFEFLRQIIDILKKPCKPKRPFLELIIPFVRLAEDEVSKISC